MPADYLDGAGLIAAEKVVKQGYKDVKNSVEVLKRHAKIMRRLKGGKRGYRLRDTKLPAKLYAGTRKNTNHALVKLPAEVKNMIFKALPTAADRACLALTCKDQASVYDELSKETNKKDYDQKVPLRTSIVHRLLLLARLKADMPAGYNLCYHCVQFIKIDDSENRGTWGGSFERVKSLVSYPLTAQGAMVEGPRCPLCIAAKQMEAASHKSTYKKYLAMAKDI